MKGKKFHGEKHKTLREPTRNDFNVPKNKS